MHHIGALSVRAIAWTEAVERGILMASETVTRFGKFPEIALTIRGKEIARLSCNQESPPRAIVQEDSTVVLVSSPVCLNQTFEIDFENENEARTVAAAINQRLQTVFGRMFA